MVAGRVRRRAGRNHEGSYRKREGEPSHPSLHGAAAMPPPYSAASLTGSIRSTLAAQNLNSGILPNGSRLGLVSRLAAASTKPNATYTTPSGNPASLRDACSTL